jgi:hypothetical protein
MVLFEQGESIEIDVDLTENGAPFVATGAVQLVVVLKIQTQSGALQEAYKYALAPISGYGKLVLQSASVARLYVEDSESRKFPTGVLFAEPTVRMPDTNFPSGVKQYKMDEPNLGRVEPGHTLNQI